MEQLPYLTVLNLGVSRGGGALVFQVGYHPRKRTFKAHPKHIFFRYEKDSKYAFLHAFILILPSCPFQICQYNNTHTHTHTHTQNSFSSPNSACFCTPKGRTHVYCLVLKNKLRDILRGWYLTSNTSAPPPPGSLGVEAHAKRTVIQWQPPSIFLWYSGRTNLHKA